jgi:hypothetical protein
MNDEVDLEDLVTIHKDEYEELLQASKWLSALQSAGLDIGKINLYEAHRIMAKDDDESITF